MSIIKKMVLVQSKETGVYKVSRHADMQLKHISLINTEKYFSYL